MLINPSKLNYREYLNSIYELDKNSGRSTSLATFSKKLGLSESNLRMVIAGKRNLTISNIHRLAQGLNLSMNQTEVFEAMVLRDQSEEASEKAFYARKLVGAQKKYRLNDVRISKTGVLKEWFAPALLVYLRENGLTADNFSNEQIQALASVMKVSFKVLNDVIQSFQNDGYLSKDPNSKEHFIFDGVNSTHSQIAYIKNCFAQAISRIDSDYPSKKSHFSIKTFSASEDRIKEFVNEYKELVEKYTSTPANDKKDRKILQVSFSAIKVIF